MLPALLLLPAPQKLTLTGGWSALPDHALILLDLPDPGSLLLAAQRCQAALQQNGVTWEVVASPAVPAELVGLHLRLDPALRPQEYHLEISAARLALRGGDLAGLFYGLNTLSQLVEGNGRRLPCLEISDYPDFAARGVLLDISRDKVPTMQTLYALIDLLAGWKINQVQLYTEHTFAYRQHPEVWAEASPMTGAEILALDAYCRARFIELVPNQNSFGHLRRWLIHPRYAPLAETHTTFNAPWGPVEAPFSLCPLDPGSLELVSSLYDELLPHFSSRMFNVGCDETFDLGQGRSRAACAQRGMEQVYLDFLLEIYAQVSRRGYQMQFWGDIILHAPQLIGELPREAIALNWGYEADHPFAAETARFQAAGIPFYVCPGTSSWNSLAGRTDNALGNLRSAAEHGLAHGAQGYLNTDWGDNGHWQTLPVSYLGFAAGAAYSWALAANRTLDLAQAASRFAFGDPAGNFGRAAYDLGNVYRAVGVEFPNSSVLFWALQFPMPELRQRMQVLPVAAVAAAEAALEAALRPLAEATSRRPDADLLRRELELPARLLGHACRRIRHAHDSGAVNPADLRREMAELLEEYRAVWLLRNRPGGLTDSTARFVAMTGEAEYA